MFLNQEIVNTPHGAGETEIFSDDYSHGFVCLGEMTQPNISGQIVVERYIYDNIISKI